MRTKGEAGTGNIVKAVRHVGTVTSVSDASPSPPPRSGWRRRGLGVPYELVRLVSRDGPASRPELRRGGIATAPTRRS